MRKGVSTVVSNSVKHCSETILRRLALNEWMTHANANTQILKQTSERCFEKMSSDDARMHSFHSFHSSFQQFSSIFRFPVLPLLLVCCAMVSIAMAQSVLKTYGDAIMDVLTDYEKGDAFKHVRLPQNLKAIAMEMRSHYEHFNTPKKSMKAMKATKAMKVMKTMKVMKGKKPFKR